jgi:hypothetical protein
MNIQKNAILLILAVALLPVAMAATLGGPSPIPNPPNFSATVTNPILCKGITNFIPVNITNLANYTDGIAILQNIQIGLSTTSGLFPDGNRSISEGNVGPGNSTIVYIPVFVSPTAQPLLLTNLLFSFSYYNFYTDSIALNITLTTESCNQPVVISISPSILATGVLQNISVNVSNTGNSPLTHISTYVSMPGSSGTVMNTEPYIINSLAAHASAHFTKSVYLSNNNNASVSIPFNISATYYNGTELAEFSEIMPVLSTGLINFTSSSFSVSPTAPTPGSIFSVSFVLTDTGTASATNLEVTPAQLPSGFKTFGATSVFVGDVSPDTQTPITVSLEANSTMKAGAYKVPLRINYMNSLRQNLTSWANTTVLISPAVFNATKYKVQSTSGSRGEVYLLVILVIVILLLLYLYLRERRNHRRSR